MSPPGAGTIAVGTSSLFALSLVIASEQNPAEATVAALAKVRVTLDQFLVGCCCWRTS
jgi:hypothetical protein